MVHPSARRQMPTATRSCRSLSVKPGGSWTPEPGSLDNRLEARRILDEDWARMADRIRRRGTGPVPGRPAPAARDAARPPGQGRGRRTAAGRGDSSCPQGGIALNDSIPTKARVASAAIVCLLWCASLPITLSRISVGAASYSIYRDDLGFVLALWVMSGLVPLALTLLARRWWMVAVGLLMAHSHLMCFVSAGLSAGLTGWRG